MTRERNVSWPLLAFALVLTACGGRTQQEVGGKTSWLSACTRDADCSALEGAVCVQQLCTVTCENEGCGGVSGTSCTESGTSCLTRAACLPDCTNTSDCRRFGSDYTCRESVCVMESCIGGETLDASVSSPSSVDADSSVIDPQSSPSSQLSTSAQSVANPPGSAPTTDVDEDSSGPPIICAVSLDAAPEQRPYGDLVADSGSTYLEGEPGCNGSCGYEYSSFDEVWVLNPTLKCPLDISTCDELQATLSASPARCDTNADCTEYTGSFRPCEPFFEHPRYFDSALFSNDERAARQAVLLEMQQRGCRAPWFGWDGYTYKLGCVDNRCQLVSNNTCDGAFPVECDACAPAEDAAASN